MRIFLHIKGAIMQTKTPAQVKQDFEQNGKPVSDWALENGYQPQEVYKVLNGQSKCKRGKAHEIAVKLGIKAIPNTV